MHDKLHNCPNKECKLKTNVFPSPCSITEMNMYTVNKNVQHFIAGTSLRKIHN